MGTRHCERAERVRDLCRDRLGRGVVRGRDSHPPRAGLATGHARTLALPRPHPAGLVPATAAFGVALPIFLWFEDKGTTESISRTLWLATIVGAVVLVSGVWRAVSAWRTTARVLDDWQRRGRRLHGLHTDMPAFAIDETFPMVAVAGILKPTLFVAERVLRECPPDEVAAMVSHECAHVSARDNVKRLLIRACPDVFGTPRRLDRAWRAAAEEAADARAAHLNPQRRLDLAQALIHVARLAPARAPELASAFYLGGSIEDRVRRLVDPPPAVAIPSVWIRFAVPSALACLALAIILAAPAVHDLMEEAVRFLP